MPTFMDRHENVEATEADVAHLHELDLAVQAKHGVSYLSYWFDPAAKAVFCFVDAPSRDAAEAVHAEAHGEVASNIIEVQGQSVVGFLGPLPPNPENGFAGSAFRSILFTDIVDSTKLTRSLGDVAAMELVRAHDRIVRGALADTGGAEVKHTGDGIMASFESVVPSIECAVAVQRRLEEHRRGSDHPLAVRIGISAGEPVTEHNDLFGAAVQLAARACASAEVGGILVSTEVRELCDAEIEFVERGPFELKGFDEPLPLYEVPWQPTI